MKKATVLGAAFIAALTFGAQSASAFCVSFGNGAGGNFCDRMEVNTSSGLLFGRWDADCDGVGDTVVGGTVGFGEADTSAAPAITPGLSWVYTFNLGTMTWSNHFTDGFTITPFNTNLPFSFTPGACPLSDGGGNRSTAE